MGFNSFKSRVVSPALAGARAKIRATAVRSLVIVLVMSAALVLLGDRLISQRQLNGPPGGEMTISGDTLAYVQMIEGDFKAVGKPYRYRILVPFMGRVLPFPPTLDLKVISYFSLFFAYVFALLTCRRLGLGYLASFGGLFALYSSVWHLYNYHNPFLTDAFQLMALSVMLFFLLRLNFTIFWAAGIIGILARETTVFLVPAWLATGQWRKSAAAVAITLVAWYLPQLFLSKDLGFFEYPSRVLSGVLSAGGLQDRPQPLLRAVFIQWGFTGVLTLIGLALVPISRFWPIITAFGLLLLGALVSSTIAADFGRIFALISPVAVVCCAFVFSTLSSRNIYLATLLALVLASRLFWVPTSLTPRESFVFDSIYPRLSVLVLEVFLTLAIAFTLRRAIVDGFRLKFGEVAATLGRVAARIGATS